MGVRTPHHDVLAMLIGACGASTKAGCRRRGSLEASEFCTNAANRFTTRNKWLGAAWRLGAAGATGGRPRPPSCSPCVGMNSLCVLPHATCPHHTHTNLYIYIDTSIQRYVYKSIILYIDTPVHLYTYTPIRLYFCTSILPYFHPSIRLD